MRHTYEVGGRAIKADMGCMHSGLKDGSCGSIGCGAQCHQCENYALAQLSVPDFLFLVNQLISNQAQAV